MTLSPAGSGLLDLIVTDRQALTESITAFEFSAADGCALPGFAAGAHIKVQVNIDGQPDWRAYSLINAIPDPDAFAHPLSYRIAVRREDSALGGRGGSLFLHSAMQVGQRLTASLPIDGFPLVPNEDDVLLIAGGIGVTPMVSMASALRIAGKNFVLHYSGRSLTQMALRSELQQLAALALYADDEPACRLDLAALLDGCKPTQPIYVCGPAGMIDAVRTLALARGWHPDRIHYESFAEAATQTGDQPFELVLTQSGTSITVPADQTILAAMLAAGLDPLFDCNRGDCGVCSVPVLEGDVDHRDNCQSQAERAAGNVIQICISRAKGQRLVLDA